MNNSKLIVANWKMNPLISEGIKLLESIKEDIENFNLPSKIVICPPALITMQALSIFSDTSVSVGSQDCHYEEIGAFTGDISFKMFEEIGCEYAIIGHSERRAYHFEDNELINKKLKSLKNSKIIPILCVGESMDEKSSGKAYDAVMKQIDESGINFMSLSPKIIAYEPIWAIGSGKTPTSDEIMNMHNKIHQKFKSQNKSDDIKVLYGGSVNAKNVAQIFSIPGVDGALIGGASLKKTQFIEILEAS